MGEPQTDAIFLCARILLSVTRSWSAADGAAATLADARNRLARMIHARGGAGFPPPASEELLNNPDVQDAWEACVGAAQLAAEAEGSGAAGGSNVVFWVADPKNPQALGDRNALGLQWPFLPGSHVGYVSGPLNDGSDRQPKRLFFFDDPIDPGQILLDKTSRSGFWTAPAKDKTVRTNESSAGAVPRGRAEPPVVSPAKARLATLFFVLWALVGSYVAAWIWLAAKFATGAGPANGVLESVFWTPLVPGQDRHFSLVLPFVAVMGAMALLAVAAGLYIKGRWFGALVDEQNRLSLSRVQQFAWSILLFGGLGTIGWFNASAAAATAADLFPRMDSALWWALGINLAISPFLSSAIKALKDDPQTRSAAAPEGSWNLVRPAALDRNDSVGEARWIELINGETVGTEQQLDVSRFQHLVVTGLLITSYFIELVRALTDVSSGADILKDMPPAGTTFLGLLAFSHSGYLAFKARSSEGGGA